jgi:hypothetical protein
MSRRGGMIDLRVGIVGACELIDDAADHRGFPAGVRERDRKKRSVFDVVRARPIATAAPPCRPLEMINRIFLLRLPFPPSFCNLFRLALRALAARPLPQQRLVVLPSPLPRIRLRPFLLTLQPLRSSLYPDLPLLLLPVLSILLRDRCCAGFLGGMVDG